MLCSVWARFEVTHLQIPVTASKYFYYLVLLNHFQKLLCQKLLLSPRLDQVYGKTFWKEDSPKLLAPIW